MSGFRLDIQRVPRGEDVWILTRMTLRGADVADTAVFVVTVVPVNERSRPESRCLQIGEPLRRELRAVLGGAEQRFDESIVVTHTGARVEAFSPSQYIIANTVVALRVEPLSP